ARSECAWVVSTRSRRPQEREIFRRYRSVFATSSSIFRHTRARPGTVRETADSPGASPKVSAVRAKRLVERVVGMAGSTGLEPATSGLTVREDAESQMGRK